MQVLSTVWSGDWLMLPYTPPPLPTGDTCYTLVRGFQGLRRKQLVIFPHWWSPNGSPNPPQLGQTGVSLCPWCCQAAVSGRREAQTHPPKPYRPEELCRFVPYPRPYPPTPDRGIFSEAENPSHELSSSTEVIKHGWFVVIDVVLLPWTDPQTLESTPMIKKKKVRKLWVFWIYEGNKMPTI